MLNRITFTGLNQLRNHFDILNGLPTDNYYPVDGEPERKKEVLQSWEALKELIAMVDAENSDIRSALQRCQTLILNASSRYERITVQYTLDQKSNDDHLPAIIEGIQAFQKLAELDLG